VTSVRPPEELEAMYNLLEESGLNRSNPRSRSAIEDFKAGGDLVECASRAVQHEASARASWVASALDPWAKRHGLTREQALSVAFNDDSFNPGDPTRDQVTLRDLHAWSGQQHGFAAYLMARGSDELPLEDEPETLVPRG